MEALLADLLDAAQAAPSAHNTQPWELSWAADALHVRLRPERAIPAADPSGVDQLHALGAMLENVMLTLAQRGLTGGYISESKQITVRWQRSPNPPPDPTLYRMIPVRRTSRLPFLPAPVSAEALAALRAVVKPPCALYVLTDTAAIDAVRKLVALAAAEQMRDRPIVRELYHWLRFSRRDPRWHRDGLTAACMGWGRFSAGLLRVMLAPWMVRCLTACRLHRLFYGGVGSQAPSAPALCLLTVDGEGAHVRIEAGRTLQRLWLTAAAHGLTTHPLSAGVDFASTRPQVFAHFGVPAGQNHVNLFRIGQSPPSARAPRLPADELLAVSRSAPQTSRRG
jgi:nitroreductase